MSTPEEVNKAAAQNTDDKPERFSMTEMGYLGGNLFNGLTRDELREELNFPRSIQTYKEMSYHSTVNSALTLFHNIITKVNWGFIPPVDATQDEIAQCKIVESMMHDMDHSWQDFITDVLSCQVYGFSVHEKVYRRRLSSKGSKFNDGIIGWRKLPIRNQETVEKFIFDSTGNNLLGVKQDISRVRDPYNRFSSRNDSTVVLPVSKILHFRTGKHKGDPFGKSPLRDAYLAWRFLTIIEEIESSAVAKDLVGLPVLSIPPQYLSADASPDQKAIYEYYKNAMRNLQLNQQSALILPNVYDPETRQPLFKLELLSIDGKKGMDTVKIKEYYKNLVLTSLFADVLVMGQTTTGSFALGQIKNSLSGSAAETLLKSIVETLNRDLVRQTYELNNWDVSRAGRFDVDDLEKEDLETFSKAVMRFASTSSLELDREALNRVRSAIGIDPLPDDLEPQMDYMPNFKSRSGDGSAAGGQNGTSNSPSGSDTSDTNLENKG